MDPITFGLIIALLVSGYFFTKKLLDYRLDKIAEQNRYSNFNKNKEKPLLDGINYAVGELEKISNEQAAILKKAGFADEVIVQILKPLKDRYDKLKWVKDHENIAIPLIEGGQNLIGKFIKGLL